MKYIKYKETVYIEFETPTEYYEWFQNNYSTEYIKRIYTKPKTIEELNSMIYYQGHGYLKMNNYLRNLENPYDKNNEKNQIHIRVREIQNFINQNEVNNNLSLYRFVGEKEYRYLLQKKKKPKIVKQFLSTTTVPAYCNDLRYNTGKLIKILLSKGSNAIAFTDTNKRNPECEILLPYNSQLKFLNYDEKRIPIFQQFYDLTEL